MLQKIRKTALKASRPSNDASAMYWIPISVTTGAYKFKFTFTSADGGNLNIRLFDTNKSTEIINFATSNEVWEYTFTESKTVYTGSPTEKPDGEKSVSEWLTRCSEMGITDWSL